MASVKILLYTKKTYTDGSHPVILQIIAGKSIKRKVIASVKKDQWDEDEKKVKPKKHPNAHAINQKLRDEFDRIENMLIKAGNSIDINSLFPADQPAPKPLSGKKKKLSFFEIADLYLEKIKAQSGNSYLTIKRPIDKFKAVVNNDNLLLSEITERHIKLFENDMKKRGNGDATRNLNWRCLRFVSKYAESERLDTKPVALHEFRLPSKKTKSLKVKLTKEELLKFTSQEVPKKGAYVGARDTFLLAVYLRGARISDILTMKQEHIKNGRYSYTSRKNKKNFDIKLIPEALSIVEKYLDGRKFLFPWYSIESDPDDCSKEENVIVARHLGHIQAAINRKIKEIAKWAGISKNITNHIARHTFAKLAADSIEDRRVTMELMGHSDLKTHQDYIMEVQSSDELDDAADGIF